MTFLVAWHTPTLALLAGDTRLTRAAFRDGDEEPERIGYDDHATGKLLPLQDGWVAGCPSMRWMARLARYVLDLSAASPAGLQHALQTCAADHMPAIAAESPERAAFIRQWFTFFVIGPTPGGFYARWLAWDGADAYGTVAPSEVIASGPRDLEPETQQVPLDGYRRAVIEDESCTLPQAVRETARLIQAIHDLGGSEGAVSDLVEIGLLLRTDDAVHRLHLSPIECKAAIRASDEQLETLLEVIVS